MVDLDFESSLPPSPLLLLPLPQAPFDQNFPLPDQLEPLPASSLTLSPPTPPMQSLDVLRWMDRFGLRTADDATA